MTAETPATVNLYHGWDYFSLPLAPLDPDPAAVFGGTSVIEYNLGRHDPVTVSDLTYGYSDPPFGALRVGDGYQLWFWQSNPWQFSYMGYPDGLGDDAMSDMCIALPGQSGEYGGTHYIGDPFNHAVEWSKCLVTDGIRTVPVWDNDPATDDAVALGWLSSTWSYRDNQSGIDKIVDPTGAQGSANLEPGQRYSLDTYKPGLALIVPVVDSTAPAAPVIADDGDYTNCTGQLHASVAAADQDSGIATCEYAVGVAPAPPSDPSTLIVPWTKRKYCPEIFLSGLSLQPHETYYVYARVRNGAGLWSGVASSDGIGIDVVAPTAGVASVSSATGANPVAVAYSGASDDFSGIGSVELWYREGSGPWAFSGSTSTTPSGAFSFYASTGGTYHFGLVAIDNAGNRSATPTGDGDCQITCSGPASSGHTVVTRQYLYDGGPLTGTSVYDGSGTVVRQSSQALGDEAEVLATSGSAEPVSFTYDALYRVKTVTDGNSHTTRTDGLPARPVTELGSPIPALVSDRYVVARYAKCCEAHGLCTRVLLCATTSEQPSMPASEVDDIIQGARFLGYDYASGDCAFSAVNQDLVWTSSAEPSQAPDWIEHDAYTEAIACLRQHAMQLNEQGLFGDEESFEEYIAQRWSIADRIRTCDRSRVLLEDAVELWPYKVSEVSVFDR